MVPFSAWRLVVVMDEGVGGVEVRVLKLECAPFLFGRENAFPWSTRKRDASNPVAILVNFMMVWSVSQ